VAKEKPERLTQAEKEKLEAELAELEGPRRAAMVEAIATARGFGDLSENFEYHAAKNEQGLLERRITMLRDRLSRVELVEKGAAGTCRGRLEVELEDDGRAAAGPDLRRRGRLAGLAPRPRGTREEDWRRGRCGSAERRLARADPVDRRLTGRTARPAQPNPP
jgi:hypothetical protein